MEAPFLRKECTICLQAWFIVGEAKSGAGAGGGFGRKFEILLSTLLLSNVADFFLKILRMCHFAPARDHVLCFERKAFVG